MRITTSAEANPLDAVEMQAVITLSTSLDATFTGQTRRYGSDMTERAPTEHLSVDHSHCERRAVHVQPNDACMPRTGRTALLAAMQAGWHTKATAVNTNVLICCTNNPMRITLVFDNGKFTNAWLSIAGNTPTPIGYRQATTLLKTP